MCLLDTRCTGVHVPNNRFRVSGRRERVQQCIAFSSQLFVTSFFIREYRPDFFELLWRGQLNAGRVDGTTEVGINPGHQLCASAPPRKTNLLQYGTVTSLHPSSNCERKSICARCIQSLRCRRHASVVISERRALCTRTCVHTRAPTYFVSQSRPPRQPRRSYTGPIVSRKYCCKT